MIRVQDKAMAEASNQAAEIIAGHSHCSKEWLREVIDCAILQYHGALSSLKTTNSYVLGEKLCFVETGWRMSLTEEGSPIYGTISIGRQIHPGNKDPNAVFDKTQIIFTGDSDIDNFILMLNKLKESLKEKRNEGNK